MSMTISQKILARHCKVKEVLPGDLIEAYVDLILGNDLTAPVAIHEFSALGNAKVKEPDKVVIVMDHFTPNKDIKAAKQCSVCRTFAREQGIQSLYDVGKVGIEHVLLPEQGYIHSGDLVIGADSHTCTYGALGAFATGVGSTDMAAAMAEGKLWFQVPKGIKVCFLGKKGKWVTGKDIILYLLRELGVSGADYCSLEFGGEIGELSMDDRLTICNMAVEAGAKNGMFPVDEAAKEYLKAVGAPVTEKLEYLREAPDEAYDRVINLDLREVEPMVAFPSKPDNGKRFDEFGEIRIDQVVIGSCTNGRLSDLKQAADILRGRKVAEGLRAIIIPATPKIYQQAISLGYIDDFIEAGCAVMTPCCGPCIGGGMGILAEGERALVTTNRNFKGRMGHVESELYLCGPAVAAASAITGRITHPQEVTA
ncbi:3-isopropylmalate dehydratase large subunit [Lacrimispora sp. 210928-DFI.3.58]|uniref:3-isopropylmalate dehydratase large subunit n=1 Tax=Lacrimispora sp. 210928-DFI.3.58 TaxID=2883214 RepID=UPI001D06D05E|nr:3-isopropylmalate dehydratase large subunit [Lacrimispora sp. 210928-DFI.3.58]MCB7319335.1 3-isopropylmalate dehydratase large subunit [Lacrimispora sp. 210928-DFI.3.58]